MLLRCGIFGPAYDRCGSNCDEHGELSVGNLPLVDLVRKLGSKNLPESEPTTLSAMAYEIARGVLEHNILLCNGSKFV
jgi:hypothetical protein